jgi:hypothetical protein
MSELLKTSSLHFPVVLTEEILNTVRSKSTIFIEYSNLVMSVGKNWIALLRRVGDEYKGDAYIVLDTKLVEGLDEKTLRIALEVFKDFIISNDDC